MSKVQGEYAERFSPLRDLFQENLDAGEELGASLAVVRHGVVLADLWGGWTDIEHSAPWVEDTLTATWSVTKTMTALAALVLVDRGELDVDSPVARYWPEFAATQSAAGHSRSRTSPAAQPRGRCRRTADTVDFAGVGNDRLDPATDRALPWPFAASGCCRRQQSS